MGLLGQWVDGRGDPKFQTSDRASPVTSPDEARLRAAARPCRPSVGALALDRRSGGACAAVVGARAMRQGAERRHARGQFAGLRRATPSTTASRSRNSGIASRPPARASRSVSPPTRRPHARPAPQPAPYRVASLEPTVPYQRPPREDQTTLVSLKSSAFPYLGNNPRTDAPFLNVSKDGRRGHRSYRRPGLLAGPDLQRQPRADACPGEFRCPQAGRDRGVLPRQRRDAGARRARPATGAAADYRFRRQCRAAGAAACGRCRRFQRRQVLAARRAQALHR